MFAATSFKGKRIALFGLGGSGLSTLRALLGGGAEISAWDDDESARQRLAPLGLQAVHLMQADWRSFDLFVLAPGVPLTHPAPHWSVVLANAAGVPIVGDIELFCQERAARAPHAPLVAITGTNGKSTTTALIAHILKIAGRNPAMGGNIGVPVFDLPAPADDVAHVLECSSYQIDLAPSLKPSVGLLLNITPDHLDRHGGLEHYAEVKRRLVEGADIALVGVDDEPSRAIAAQLKARCAAGDLSKIIAISAQPSPLADLWVEDHRILSRQAGADRIWVDLAQAPALRGAHNGQNAAFAFAAARALDVPPQIIADAIASFPGLAHRMEPLGSIGKTIFVNDSKATNADAAEKALLSFKDIYWILGGKAKAGGIEALRPLFPRIAKAYLIGEASDEFAHALQGGAPYERCGFLEAATIAAAHDASSSAAREPVVLLSPACASFDQFANFEVRGESFRAIVAKLIATSAPQAQTRGNAI